MSITPTNNIAIIIDDGNDVAHAIEDFDDQVFDSDNEVETVHVYSSVEED